MGKGGLGLTGPVLDAGSSPTPRAYPLAPAKHTRKALRMFRVVPLCHTFSNMGRGWTGLPLDREKDRPHAR